MRAESDCREEAVLLRYLDDALDPPRRAQVHRHLDTCPACRRRLEGFRATLDLARMASTPKPNPLFASGFSHKVRQGIEIRRRQHGRLRFAAGVAAVCGCLLGAVWLTASSAGPGAGVPRLEEVAREAGDEVGAAEELASLIDSYLLETASTDELMGEMQALDPTELVVMIEED